jgi:Winged helix DNA-binding domain
VRTWAMRTTMHLLAAEDFHWLVPLFAEQNAAFNRRRLAHFGIEPKTRECGLRLIERSLTDHGPLTRGELAERLEEEGVRLTTETRMHLFMLAVNSGLAVLGPDRGGQTCLALERDWLGKRPKHDRAASLAELARRYLRAFAPATEADFAGWAGLGLRDVRAGLTAIAAELREVRIGPTAAFALRKRARTMRGRTVRLLPAWDTFLMGHRDRAFLAGGGDWRQVMPGGGILRPSILLDGALAGTWTSKRRGGGLRIGLEPFTELDGDVMEALDAEVADIGRFEGAEATLAT